jgi:Phage portal protein/Phage Mu protein F like protein
VAKPVVTPISQGMVSRALAGVRNMFAGQQPSSIPPPFDPPFSPYVLGPVNWRIQLPPVDWFGPGQPLTPVAPPDMAGRQYDFPSYSNIDVLQKPREGVDFPILRQVAQSYWLAGVLIDTRCDQICRLGWSIGYLNDAKKADARTDKITQFLYCPDGEHSWQEWIRVLLRDMLEIDAATVFPRQTRGGDLYALEYVDGATVNRIIDNYGRTPLAPDPAYQQRLKGLPAINYTREQLIYKPRNISSNKLFGTSPIERAILMIQIALSRDLYKLQYYTDGAMPDLLMTVPGNAKQVKEFSDWFNGLLEGNTAQRRKGTFLPEGAKAIDLKDKALTDPFDELLARYFCYTFGMSPQPFVSQMNRATAETADQQAKEEGIGPHMAWVKQLMDSILSHPRCFNSPDLEFTFEDADETDPALKAKIDDTYIKNGTVTIDEVRDDMGKDPLPNGLGAQHLVYTGQGAVLLDSVVNPPEPEPMLALPGPDAVPGAKPAFPNAEKFIKELLAKGMPVNAEFDVPYGFGISKDGQTIYRDKDIPQMLDVDGVMIDLDETCSVHEITEFSHCKDGDPYLQGHQKADEAEHPIVAKQGADPARYETVLAPLLEVAYLKGKAGKAQTPPDLATYPYVESGEQNMLTAEKLSKKKTEPSANLVGRLKATVAKALKSAAREVATQYAHKFGKASGSDDWDQFLKDLELPALASITGTYTSTATDQAEEAFTDVLAEFGDTAGPVFGLANTRAQQIAEDRAADLVTEIDDATRLLMRGTVADAFENGWSSSELSDALEASYGFSADRADVIAETEMRMAIGAGAIEGARASGVVTGKQWLLSNDEGICDICEANADQDVIDLDEDFDSGDDTVPAHPNCRCVVVFTTDQGDEE